MIVSASYRTDIPAFYGAWFIARFRAGYCRVNNPYGGRPGRVLLRHGVDGYVFWTRNATPFRPALALLSEAGLPFVVQYTVTNYPRPLESAVVAAPRAVDEIRHLAGQFGRRAVVWRYDPILVSTLTSPDWHAANFAELAGRLRGSVDEVVTSFAQIYRKTRRNLAAAARLHGFAWQDPAAADKAALLSRLATVAADHGMRLTLCTQPELVTPEIGPASCIDAERLSELAGRTIAAKIKGNRPGCLCAESRDIGDYDSCPQGCVYCYAVGGRRLAKARFAGHDPAGEFLFANAFPGEAR